MESGFPTTKGQSLVDLDFLGKFDGHNLARIGEGMNPDESDTDHGRTRWNVPLNINGVEDVFPIEIQSDY